MDNKTKELILFWITEKSHEASIIEDKAKGEVGDKFWRGYRLACTEISSLINNIATDDE